PRRADASPATPSQLGLCAARSLRAERRRPQRRLPLRTPARRCERRGPALLRRGRRLDLPRHRPPRRPARRRARCPARGLSEWGSPHLSTTPTSLAIQELAVQVEALEVAVREIALEVQKLSSPG